MRFRLYPTSAQEAVMVEHCAHARYVWNLALEQANMYRPGLGSTPATIAENVMRGEGFGPVNAAKTHCPQNHPYDEENTYRNPRTGYRECRTCMHDKYLRRKRSL